MNGELIMLCGTCRKPVEGDTGFIAVTYQDIREAQTAKADHDTRRAWSAVTLEAVTVPLPGIAWKVLHDHCAAACEMYQVDSGQLRTFADLAWWTAHLMAKSWFPLTDWDEVLREASGRSASPSPRVSARLAGAA